MRQARACWPVLVKKANDEVLQLQTELGQALARVDQLEASHQRLCRLYDEYRLKEQQPQTEAMGMQASMNQRQFMGQLLNLQQRKPAQEAAKPTAAPAQAPPAADKPVVLPEVVTSATRTARDAFDLPVEIGRAHV